MKNTVYAKMQQHKNCSLIHIFSKNSNYNIDVCLTLPFEEAPSEKIVLLSALTILEPLCRCGEEIELVTPFDAKDILLLNEEHKINESIKLYANLKWTKSNISYLQGDFSVEDIVSHFINKNTIEIFNVDLAKLYSQEISKTLPYALYERMRSECDYAWPCRECPEGQCGRCEAITYEEYVLLQNQNQKEL